MIVLGTACDSPNANKALFPGLWMLNDALNELRTIVGGKVESCVVICPRKQLICEMKFFLSRNVEEILER